MKFEAGKTYQTRSICDNDCIFEIKVLKRTEKSISFIDFSGKTKSKKIHTDNGVEFIFYASYSMAPIFRANKHIA